jgi:hypothetical protein
MITPQLLSEHLQYHVKNGLSVTESVFRPGSRAHIELLVEARQKFDQGSVELVGVDRVLFIETDLGRTGIYEGAVVPLDFPIEEINEAKYHDKEVKLNYPQRGGQKKYHVYTKNPQTGKVIKISFGDVHGGLTAKVSNPKARASFAARHQCHLKKDRTKAGYWACRINRYAHLWGGKTYPGFW